MHQGVVGARDEGPEATGRLTELLVNHDLLEDRPALATDFGRQRATDEARIDRRLADRPSGLRIQAAAASLEVKLERLEDVARELTRSILELELSGAERQVHRGKDGARDKPSRRAVAGRGTAGKRRGPVGDRPSISVAPDRHGHKLLLLY
jgi:hypothetical protein